MTRTIAIHDDVFDQLNQIDVKKATYVSILIRQRRQAVFAAVQALRLREWDVPSVERAVANLKGMASATLPTRTNISALIRYDWPHDAERLSGEEAAALATLAREAEAECGAWRELWGVLDG